MSRSLKARTLALAALSIFTASCASTYQTQVRVINALSDAPALDVYINTTQITAGLGFTQVQPAPPTYRGAPSGNDTIAVFNAGSTVNPILEITGDNAILNGSTQYTVILDGFYESPTAVAITDNNAVPTSNMVEYRIINAAPDSPTGGVDVYIVPPGADITQYTPQITALFNGQGSLYQSLPFVAAGYAVIVTAPGGKTALVNQPSNRPAGSITTMVLVNNLGGINGGMSRTPVVLNDVN
jgi:hypothetical protein